MSSNEKENKPKVIDVGEVRSVRELHKILKDELDFSNYYGMNWDAFWDMITGQVELPETIHFIGWENLESRLPKDSKILVDIFKDLHDMYPMWKCNVEYR